jgi:transcriptional regulator with XRE-family HTH domain
MDSKVIGNFICARRKDMGMTQQQLADILDVTNKAISKWETGEGYPDITIVPGLCKALSVTADELLAGEMARNGNGIPYGPLTEEVHVNDFHAPAEKPKRKTSTTGSNLCIALGIVFTLLIFIIDIGYHQMRLFGGGRDLATEVNFLPVYAVAMMLTLIGVVFGTVRRVKRDAY